MTMFNDINISKVISNHRKLKGITQEQLAEYMGVSKASVSKWEKGHSFPDITLLPKLAAYFNISIDELMGYTPKMTKVEIKNLYIKLCADFANEPFEEVLEACRDIIKKYYSCYPLLLQIVVLYINHFMLTENQSLKLEILKEAIDISKRIELDSGDIQLSKVAVSLAATCHLLLGEPQNTLEILGESINPMLNDESKIAQAYLMQNQKSQADKVIQISIYQHLLALMSDCNTYLSINNKKFDDTLNKIITISTAFSLEYLHPNTMAITYLSAAQVYCMNGNHKDALKYLEKYRDLCTTAFFPFSLRGDSYFTDIEEWFSEFSLGEGPPRSESVIKTSMISALTENPVFEVLKDDTQFKKIINSLVSRLGGIRNE